MGNCMNACALNDEHYTELYLKTVSKLKVILEGVQFEITFRNHE